MQTLTHTHTHTHTPLGLPCPGWPQPWPANTQAHTLSHTCTHTPPGLPCPAWPRLWPASHASFPSSPWRPGSHRAASPPLPVGSCNHCHSPHSSGVSFGPQGHVLFTQGSSQGPAPVPGGTRSGQKALRMLTTLNSMYCGPEKEGGVSVSLRESCVCCVSLCASISVCVCVSVRVHGGGDLTTSGLPLSTPGSSVSSKTSGWHFKDQGLPFSRGAPPGPQPLASAPHWANGVCSRAPCWLLEEK